VSEALKVGYASRLNAWVLNSIAVCEAPIVSRETSIASIFPSRIVVGGNGFGSGPMIAPSISTFARISCIIYNFF
jgi:hypothetical protein